MDEIFLPWRELFDELPTRGLSFGVQARVDLWKPGMIERLGNVACVSIEAGVAVLTAPAGAALDKDCRMETDDRAAHLVLQRRPVPFVQANPIARAGDDAGRVAAWKRAHAHAHAHAELARFSDIQDAAPRPLAELERACRS